MVGFNRQKVLQRLVFGVVVFALAITGLSISPQKASADICSVNGRDCYYGYFFNGYDGGAAANGTRHNLLRAPALLGVGNAYDLVTAVDGFLGGCPGGNIPNPNDQNSTGAAFIVLTMLGFPPGTDKNVACQRFSDWEDKVYNYEASGLTNFNINYDFGGINTRSTLTDVAYYPMNGSANSIVFYSPTTGLPVYAIKKDCGNPLGKLGAIDVDYNLTPSITATVNGVSTGTAEAGDNITFTYNVFNSARTDSGDVDCNAAAINHSGYFNTPPTPESGGSNVPVGCPRSFARNSNTVLASQTATSVPANSTICRTLFVNPSTPGGAPRGTEVCIPVVKKPYLMVYGGDVSAGGDVETAPDTCSSNPSASIVSWNKGPASGFAGAGVQYAAYALAAIKEFSTAQYGPTAPPPITGVADMPGGFSFSSTTQNIAAGKYGGDFGSAKCIKDYYSQIPAGSQTSLPPNVDSMDGNYSVGSGGASVTTLTGGNVTPGKKIRLFVDGDLYITSNITYTGSWSYDKIPMIEVVARGNIYIDRNVTQLDGTYVAQPLSDNSRGYTYTCTTGASAPSLTQIATNYASVCNSKLTINGSLVSRSIQFLRNSGTLHDADNGEKAGTSNDAAEVFNYGPGFWISQPSSSTASDHEIDSYDAVTSLPPVL